MDLRILGPLEASVDGRGIALAGPKQRAVLAMLGLQANRLVTVDHLIEGLWGEHVPASAPKMVQNYVWRLRTALGGDPDAQIVTRTHGYELRIDPDRVDVLRFGRLLAEARRAADGRQPADAARQALALWRGDALADLADEPFAAPEIRRLGELRLQAAELAIDADLAAGRHQDVAAEIEGLVGENPLHERFHAQRMLALYRCGRQADALAAYRDARRTLVEEVGLEPGAELRRLHEAILRQDPALDVEPAVAELPPELDPAGAPALVGRARELGWLRQHWRKARAGQGALVVVVGEQGMGKTRLAAELAGEVHGSGGSVVVAAGTHGADRLMDACRRMRTMGRPALLVFDASAKPVGDLGDLVREVSAKPVLAVVMAQRIDGLAQVAHDSLVLGPLDEDAVREIAHVYAGGDREEVPVRELLEASGGVAGRVHEVASAWARRAAERRVVAFAPRAAAGRSALRSAEARLAGGVADLQAVRERAARRLARDRPMGCPYKGLASFEVCDAPYFFGRERLVAELVARAVGAPLLAVVGPSGSGKSSVVKAGLLPALADGVLPGSDHWRQVVLRPGEHPARELRGAGIDVPGGTRYVLVVDQFEEVFTTCRYEHERRGFIDALVRAAQADRGLIVLAVRADFYGRCAAYPTLSTLVGANQILVGPMSRGELRRAIEGPAQLVGIRVEPNLVDRMVADVDGEPGGLPLLSSALLELWPRRHGSWLRDISYDRTGGVRGAVARLAEEAYGGLDARQQSIARGLLLRLAGEGSGGGVVRRRVPLAELEADDEAVAAVLRALTDRRLLTMSSTAVEVAHEALLREWPRLRGWLEEDVEGRRVRRHLAEAARDWDERGRDSGDLYRGARLAVASEWCAGHEHELNRVERAFLDAGRTAAQRAQRRLLLALAGVAALCALALAGGLVAVRQRGTARLQARAADAQRIGVEALAEPDLDRSLLLARQAVALDDSTPTRSDLLAALLRAPAVTGMIPATGNPVTALDVNRDARTLALGDNRGRVFFVDALTRRPAGAPLKPGDAIAAVRFSADGSRLAVAGYTGGDLGFIDLFDAGTHRRIRRLSTGFDSKTTSSGPLAVGTVAFSADSHLLAADILADGPPSGYRRYIVRWDARSGRRLGAPAPITSRPPSSSLGAGPVLKERRHPTAFLVGFIGRGARMLTTSAADDTTVIREGTTLRAVRRLRGAGSPAAVSPDGRLAALGVRDGSVRLLDLRTDRARVIKARGAPVTALRFTPDSSRLVAARGDAPPIVWDAERGSPLTTLAGLGNVERLAFTADGTSAFGAGEEGTAVEWDLTGARGLGRPFSAGRAPAGLLATTARGRAFAVPDRRDAVNVLDSRTLTRVRQIRVPAAKPVAGGSLRVAITSDGRTMAATTGGGEVRFMDLRTGRPLGPASVAHVGPVQALAFSPDGRWLATSGADHAIYAWDVRRRRTVGLYAGAGTQSLAPATGLSVSPDGRKLAATVGHRDGSGELDIFSLPRLALLARVPTSAGRQTEFSNDGRMLFYGDTAGRVWTYDTRTWKRTGLPFAAQRAPGNFALSPDQRMLATTSRDGTTQLWDVHSRRPIGSPLVDHVRRPVNAAFLDHGRRLVTLHDDGRGEAWDLDPRSWERRACAIAGRTLTRTEWQDVLPGRAYTPACARR